MLLLILAWLLIGLVIGGLGRFLVPGRNRIGLALTILIGIAGAIGGGWVSRLVAGRGNDAISFVFALVIAAVLVAIISGSQRSGRYR